MKANVRTRFAHLAAQGSTPVGSFCMSADPSTTAVFASVGYDFVIIDREHGMIDLSAAVGHVRAAEAGGISPLIRVLEPSAALVQQAMDLGAHGVIVPKSEDPETVSRLVAASRYQPGGRGKCPQVPAADFASVDWQPRAARQNAESVLIPLIETAAGVERAAEIAGVDGVDLIFFGPADLSQDLGLDMYEDLDQVQQIWRDLVKALAGSGVLIGAPAGFGFEAEADFVTIGSDLGNLRTTAVNGLAELRSAGS